MMYPRSYSVMLSNSFGSGIMPDDNSYKTTKAFRDARPDWFARGHLAAKLLAERLGADAAWNTHAFHNAVPQMQLFNAGIWLDMAMRAPRR